MRYKVAPDAQTSATLDKTCGAPLATTMRDSFILKDMILSFPKCSEDFGCGLAYGLRILRSCSLCCDPICLLSRMSTARVWTEQIRRGISAGFQRLWAIESWVSDELFQLWI